MAPLTPFLFNEVYATLTAWASNSLLAVKKSSRIISFNRALNLTGALATANQLQIQIRTSEFKVAG